MNISSASSSLECLSDAPYSHRKLGAPADQIRLLEIKRHQSGKLMELCLSVHSWATVPDYYAISYTWGDPEDMQTVLIDHRPMAITKNCHYALTQACLHRPRLSSQIPLNGSPRPFYLWIDSICIDQSSAYEKGHQVAMMGRIYAKASKVLACVGPHHDNSHELAELLHCLKASEGTSSLYWRCKSRLSSISCTVSHDDFLDLDFLFELYLDQANISWLLFRNRFSETFLAFACREYWSRVWIMQEIAVSFGFDDRLEVFCGCDYFIRSEIYLIYQFLLLLMPPQMERSWPDNRNVIWEKRYLLKTVLDLSTTNPIPAHVLFDEINRDYKCSRPEDRVYGLLPLIKWPEGVQAVQPVYGPTATFDLAELFISIRPSVPYVFKILRGLDIYHDDYQMKELVRARCDAAYTKEDQSNKYPLQTFEFGKARCIPLFKNAASHLEAALEYSENTDSTWKESANSQALAFLSSFNCVHTTPQALFCDSAIGALLCNGAREDDFIVKTGFGQGLLVIRRIDQSDQCDIIGQGLLLNGYDITSVMGWNSHPHRRSNHRYPRSTKSLETWNTLDAITAVYARRIFLKPIDMILLEGQDLERNGGHNDGMSLQRITTVIHGTVQIVVSMG